MNKKIIYPMNKKIIYQVGIKLNIKYTKLIVKWISLFKKEKIKTSSDEWIIRNVKYIYASSAEEAISKYELMFKKIYVSLSGWGDWYDCSKNINLDSIGDFRYTIINQETIIVEEDTYPKNIEELKKNMSAYEFRAWWNDYNCGDIMEVLK
jgi:hypothetical protein